MVAEACPCVTQSTLLNVHDSITYQTVLLRFRTELVTEVTEAGSRRVTLSSDRPCGAQWWTSFTVSRILETLNNIPEASQVYILYTTRSLQYPSLTCIVAVIVRDFESCIHRKVVSHALIDARAADTTDNTSSSSSSSILIPTNHRDVATSLSSAPA